MAVRVTGKRALSGASAINAGRGIRDLHRARKVGQRQVGVCNGALHREVPAAVAIVDTVEIAADATAASRRSTVRGGPANRAAAASRRWRAGRRERFLPSRSRSVPRSTREIPRDRRRSKRRLRHPRRRRSRRRAVRPCRPPAQSQSGASASNASSAASVLNSKKVSESGPSASPMRSKAASSAASRNHLAVEADPFAIIDQVRRREHADAMTAGTQHRIQHPDAGAFAVGAADRDDRLRRRLPAAYAPAPGRTRSSPRSIVGGCSRCCQSSQSASCAKRGPGASDASLKSVTRDVQGLGRLRLRHEWRATRQRREHRRDAFAQVATVHDHVDRAVLEQELAALEALGQCLAHGLLDDARAGESNQRRGSAMFRSPSIARLAETPPVVGSVSTEM